MKAKAIGRKAIRIINSAVNYIVLIIIVLLTAFAGYALWDSNQLHKAADKHNYAAYKPTAENQAKSFRELQDINEEVFAWLSVYGTNIDYPVTQAATNMKYVNTSAEGRYSLSGSIFLDCRNSNDFSDFNSIIYGHHMAKQVMFGEIGNFADSNVFNSNRYGNLYFDGKDHGIEFFAFVHADAYDSLVFTPNVHGARCEDYLDGLRAKAIHTRDIAVTAEDRIVLLSTCSSRSTNGRDILAGRISDEVYDDQSENMTASDWTGRAGPDRLNHLFKENPVLRYILALIPVIAAIVCVLVAYHRKVRRRRKNRKDSLYDYSQTGKDIKKWKG